MVKYDHYEGEEKEKNVTDFTDYGLNSGYGKNVFTFCCYQRKNRVYCEKLKTGYVCQECYYLKNFKVLLDNHEKTHIKITHTKMLSLKDLIEMEEKRRGPSISMKILQQRRKEQRLQKKTTQKEPSKNSSGASGRAPKCRSFLGRGKCTFLGVKFQRKAFGRRLS